MRGSGRIRKLLPLFIVLPFFLIAGTLGRFFLSRSPVLIVTDSSFSQLYGLPRLKREERRISIILFRQVIPVTVAESAGPDLVAIAAEGAFDSPWAILFPYRYVEGARLYKEAKPETPVFVMGAPRGTAPPAESGHLQVAGLAITYVCTDTILDLYRAGLSAGLLAGEKKALIFDDELFPEEYRESLREEFRGHGFLDEPVFLAPSSNYSDYSDIGCVVVAGPASKFLDQNLDIPVVLFSWADPAMTPRTVKLVFDDSPWTLAVKALKPLSQGNEIFIPAEPKLMKDRIDEKRDFRKLKSLLKEKFQKS